ncbi:5'-methylthioadenosine/S-adenosylhomocysteine nucleosidase [Salinimonas sediminis]|uniref:5'-methylthioadenosine nucleosidase n=1 Tax=Salinimonas sediminis TaxID=2303538 RepID=A0A346NIL1_9ALTE|nr:5'-methylthioadenosine/S-adenosylhomocysteine nucleosidase [Salinimonas sediminis]AXR05368.1 5'-methylthioadenosine nucleosidase [Salinimonas sediminis]
MNITIRLFTFLLLCTCTTVLANTAMKQVTVAGAKPPQSPIMIQGPMPIEAEYFAALLDNVEQYSAGNAVFYSGYLNGYPVVVVKTGKGLENTAAATAIGISLYHPRIIINQGTSGGHDPALAVGDIVLGSRSVNASNFKTPHREAGAGSKPLDWIPMDLMASQGSAGEGDSAAEAQKLRYYEGDKELISLAMSLQQKHSSGKVVKGTIGSGNFWNNELDRIAWLHQHLGTSVEEMESASAAQIAHAYGVPFLAIRILSNNITNHGKYDPTTAKACQQFVKVVVEAYIRRLKDNETHAG